jgi:hypothetical protein
VPSHRPGRIPLKNSDVGTASFAVKILKLDIRENYDAKESPSTNPGVSKDVRAFAYP